VNEPVTEPEPTFPSAEECRAMGVAAYAAGIVRCPKEAWTPHGGDSHFRKGWEAAHTAYRRKVADDLTAALGAFLKEWAG
jgi:hypothetical protein